MKEILGDLLKSDEVDVMVHVCNNHHVMGSGIAYFLKKKWPQVYEADLETERDCESKMGTFSKALVDNNRVVYNLYAMWGVGNDGHPLHRNLSYDSFYNGMFRIIEDVLDTVPLQPIIIGVPKNIGCCRAGGSWEIVEAMLYELEQIFDGHIEFYVYNFEEAEKQAQSSCIISPGYTTPM